MALQDVFRDTGALTDSYKEAEAMSRLEYEKYEKLSTAELWNLHISYSLFSPQGQVVLEILKTREPQKFKSKESVYQ